MYKITIKETVGELTKETTIETEDVELVKELLFPKPEIKDNDEQLDEDNETARDKWKKQLEEIWKKPEVTPPFDPRRPYSPWEIGSPWFTYPITPIVNPIVTPNITC